MVMGRVPVVVGGTTPQDGALVFFPKLKDLESGMC